MSDNIKQNIVGDHNKQTIIKNYHNHVGNISTLLGEILPEISKIVHNRKEKENDIIPYNIEEKVQYNNISSPLKEIIEDFGQYEQKINTIYDEHENHNPGFKTKILQYFKIKYIFKKDELLINYKDKNSMQVIQSNSNKITHEIFYEFLENLKNANNISISMEELQSCALTIVCHAFINCKILEKPNHDN